MILYRPVGLHELRLVFESGMRRFPPRLPDQPIFYPVTNDGYARQIARDWNTKSHALVGFVTRFVVDEAYVSKFERRVVGAREHEELWVPAEELDDFNARIEGSIDVTSAYFGEGFQGAPSKLGGTITIDDARTQLVELAGLHDDVLDTAISSDAAAMFLNFFFWAQVDVASSGIDQAARDALLDRIRGAWSKQHALPLGLR